MKIVDLHVHSIVSDGSFRPEELAKHAKDCGLSAFTLTDHDNIAGNDEAAAAARDIGIEFINGMELTAEYSGRKIHIVCLGFDPDHPSFQQVYQRIRAIKEGRIVDMIDFVARKGVPITLEKVKAFAQGRPIDRYAIMRYLVSLHMYDRAQPLWDNYLDPAAVELGLNVNITAEEALPRIREAGGVTSLEHFHKDIGLKGLTRKEQETAILHLHSMGLDGMERFYPNYSEEDADFAKYMIEKYNLMPTGGTDFHGDNRPDVAMGTGIGGNMAVPYEFFAGVKKRCGII